MSLRVVVTLGKFGQRNQDTLDVSDLVDPSDIKAISVHLTLRVSSKNEDTHILLHMACRIWWE